LISGTLTAPQAPIDDPRKIKEVRNPLKIADFLLPFVRKVLWSLSKSREFGGMSGGIEDLLVSRYPNRLGVFFYGSE